MNKVLYRLNPRVKLLNDFFVFDTETGKRNKDGSIQWLLNAQPESFIFGCIYGKNYNKVFHSRTEMINEFKKPEFKNKYVFAHNAEYDLSVLYGNIITDLDNEAIFNGKFISAKNGNCIFADSTNIFGRVKLSEIGTKLGIEKPQLGNEFLVSEKVGASEINRCMTDCIIVYEGLIRMFESAGDIKITQASLSLTYFRRFHQPYNIEHNEHTANFWNSYYGGRTEVYKLGNTHAQVIDINSSYPYAMKNTIFPNPKFLKKVNGCTAKHFINYYLEHFEGCAKLTVKHPDIYIGLLPYKKDGKLIFPVGTFSGTWNFNELRFALKNGVEIISIDEIVYSEKMVSPFVSYVDTLYNERITSDSEFEIFRIKIFMNSLYGKFAQRISEENIYLNDIDKHLDLIREYQNKKLFIRLQMFSHERNDAFLIIKSLTGKSINYAIPSFSSYITSEGRIKLAQKILDMKNNIPVYCDTDSIFFESGIFNESTNVLGGWKLENKIITQINGLKNYRYYKTDKPNKILRRLKGVPDNAIELQKNLFSYSNLVKTKEGLRRNTDNGILTERVKKIFGIYDKRVILDDGINTQPIKLYV